MAIVTTDDKHYKDIANKIRENTATEDTISPSEMAEKIQKVYEAGKDNGIRAMWEAIQGGGTKNIASGIVGSSGWTKETFKPIYDVRPTSCYQWSFQCPLLQCLDALTPETQVDIVELEKEQGIVFDFGSVSANTTNYTQAFTGPLFKRWNVIDITKASVTTYAFYGGYLTTGNKYNHLLPTRIERLIFSENTNIAANAFQYATGYEYIGFEGTIASTINLSWSPLCPESMKKAILCLKNYAGTDSEFIYEIKFSDDCWAALEADSTSPAGTTWQEYVESLGWLV